jgi:hypothetical protein
MSLQSGILEKMMEADIRNSESFEISHHTADSPLRIPVMRDEILYIHQIEMQASANFWFEFHSASESRLLEYSLTAPTQINSDIVTRHKGSVYFSQSTPVTYVVHYVKLKILPL